MCYRGVAQVVARMTGGHEAASSSLVTPMNVEKAKEGGESPKGISPPSFNWFYGLQ